MTTLPRPRSLRAQRGISLLEALVAAGVLVASTLAVTELNRHLRLGSDVARERTEALRLGSEELERLRAFAVVDAASAAHSYAAIADRDGAVDGTADRSAHAVYRIERRVDGRVAPGAKAVTVAVRWNDRDGSAREVVQHSFIAAAAPRYAGALALGSGAVDSAPRGVGGRAPGIPVTARAIGHGRSAWKPTDTGTTALVFDDASGDVVGNCAGIAPAVRTRDLTAVDLAACTAGRWLPVSGTVRFTSATPPLPSRAGEPPPSTTLSIGLAAGPYPASPHCVSEARKTVRYVGAAGLRVDDVPIDASPASRGVDQWDDSGDRFLAWHCLVAPRADGTWSGRATLVADGWAIGSGSAARRVCRYSGGGPIDANIGHPADYRDVDRSLVAQDFLVVRGSDPCPPDGTVQHQP